MKYKMKIKVVTICILAIVMVMAASMTQAQIGDIPADFTWPDGVDFIDFAELAAVWLSSEGDGNWNEIYTTLPNRMMLSTCTI